jgi:ABC-type nitrate/sulfonate/bicarbonate transport system substrate-binding protein
MSKILSVAMVLGLVSTGSVFAQTTAPSASTAPPAVATTNTNNTTAAPAPGANSFTMAQAKKRLEDHGYTEVSALAKDSNSIWRGHAMKDGKPVDVSLDYQGNITAN